MKILLLSNMYPSNAHVFYGVFVRNFCKNMEEQGAIVDKVVIRGRGKGWLTKLAKYIYYYFRCFVKISSGQYDLIYVHSASHALLPVTLLWPIITKPVVVNIHGSDAVSNGALDSTLFKINRHTLLRCRLVVFPSFAFMEKVLQTVNLPFPFVSPSGGIDRSLFHPKSNTYHIKPPMKIGYISRIDEGKGWDTFIEALSIIKEYNANLDIRAVIVGAGSQVSSMLELINDLGLKDKIQHINQLPQNRLPDIYRSINVFVFPSKRESESLGLVGLEAMSCGIPIIASRIGGITDYLTEGQNGFFAKPGDPDDLAQSIIKFSALGISQLELLSKNAVETAKKYDSKENAVKLYRELEKLCRA